MLTINDVYNYGSDEIGLAGIIKSIYDYDHTYGGDQLADVLSQYASLDVDYHLNISGNKWVTPMLDKLVNMSVFGDGKHLNETGKVKIAQTIYDLNLKNWLKVWETLNQEYNIIHNYDRTEKYTGDDTVLHTPTNRKMIETQTPTEWKATETQTPTNWKSETTGSANDNETTSEHQIKGFNSSSYSDADKTTTSTKNKQTTTQSGTYERETEQSGSFKTETEETGTLEDKTSYNKTVEIYGNIGVMTSQDMIKAERDLWVWNYFRDYFYDTIDNMCTLKVY